MTIRVAAVGDIHIGEGMHGCYADDVAALEGTADVLLLAGDLTRHGTVAEAKVVAGEFTGAPVPVVAVLGNHDLHSDEGDGVTAALTDAGITVLECSSTVLVLDGVRLGVAGTVGFGGGFPSGMVADFGEPEMKAFAARGRALAAGLGEALRTLDCDVTVALTHYAPVPETLEGEPREIYPFLGSHLLADVIDSCGVALALHGHAHAGFPDGRTRGGVPVHNVARPLLHRPYRVFPVEPPD
ncbi:Icc-related predicted phosphoesterase [Pseudonocardia hierapolitana]|uniref:Icc-related predicted phosphoesterase n=1 Tax=Pseudonocardia hierapolitana TaxID=1128676 RepID=A0A561T4G3_9PSEU|nr:metallophosphoesterase [Pseudonocardia hierapolitana]TWF81994.1 Icc-related predicted phosphoesterase [Pseudonocardia hierapolitana]